MTPQLLVDLLRTSLSALSRSRMRTFLSVLGIVIGVAAVIAMTSVGAGASQEVQARLQSLGTNLLIVTPGSASFASMFRGSAVSQSTLTYGDAQALADKTLAPDVKAVAPVITKGSVLRYAGTAWNAQVQGTTPSLLTIRNLTVAQGRFLDARDVASSAPVIVLGPEVVQALFPPGVDPVGQFVSVDQVPFQVIGVLAPVGAQGPASQDNICYVPITTAFVTLFPADVGENLPQILLSATSARTLDLAAGEVTAVLMARHHLTFPEQPDFTVTSQTSLLATAQSIASTIGLLLAASAAISLLVGGIGIMNIMTVSVTERTREIGIRMAVGAPPSAILVQFFLEAVLISLAGGLAGVLLGAGAAFLLPHVVHGLPTALHPGAVLLAVAVSLAIGVAFGYYPARRAAALDPVDALAYE